MRLGIRGKLVGTLLLAGLLPLALALGVILVGVVELRVQSRGRMHRALAQQQAGHLSSILGEQVELVNLVNGMPGTVEFLRKADEAPPLSQAQIDAIEKRWPDLPANDPLIKGCLTNEVAARWASVAGAEPRFAEVMVTDASGRLVAATHRTSDYFQADEPWWQLCWNGGRGRVLISDVVFDESAVPPGASKRGALVADLCLPIYDGTDVVRRKVVGICKVSLHATWMLRQLDMAEQLDDVPHAVWLVRSDGRAVPGADPPPPVADLPTKTARRVAEESSGWLKDSRVAGHELIGFAAVEQSRLMDRVEGRWHVVVASDVHAVAASVYRLAWKILAAGLVVIAGCFLGGLVLARREVIRPLLTLEHAVDQIAHGNRDYRLSEARGRRETFRDDELGRLAEDFNAMAAELQANLERLEEADALKRQFIDLASHELRTPVTYILGASQLAQRQNGDAPPGAARDVMGKVASKAQRLNRIVENMFKLLASDRFDKSPRWEDVDVAALVRAVVEEHEPFVRERRQHWRIEVAPDLPTIRGESYKVKDILTNLVSNAIRFSPDGGEVGVTARPVDGGVEIEVSDSGPGIPQKDLPELFQPFFTGGRETVERHTSGDYQHMSRGMGLGLSVVKRFVDLHGGTVSVDTSPEGTRVRVFLPREPRPAPAGEPRPNGGGDPTHV
jgi:signal transduction histidine kinase